MEESETITKSRPQRTLNSWKEIGEYLKRDSRTAQRWEHDKKLPVHRIPGGKRAAIYAFTDEIDVWLGSAEIDSVGAADEKAPSFPVSGQRPRLPRHILALTIVILIVGGALLLVFRSRSEREHIARIAVHGNLLHVFDFRGRELWHYKLASSSPVDTANAPERPAYLAALLDVDHDGFSEVLIGHNLQASQSSGEIICLNRSGKLIWSYRPSHHLVFGDQEFRDPWMLQDMLVLDNNANPIVFAVLNSTSWASTVVRIDGRTGNSAIVFVNSGPLYLIKERNIAARTAILLGGFNVETQAPIVAVLDPLLASVSPQSLPQYKLKDASFAPAERYIILPRSEFSDGEHTIPQIAALSIGDDHLQVTVREPNTELLHAERIFTFRDDGQVSPISVRFSPDYWSYHEIRERLHTLNHRRQACPLLQPQRVHIYINGRDSFTPLVM